MALLLQLSGTILCFGLSLILFHHPLSTALFIPLCAGLLLNIEHVFYEYLSATNDGYSALLCRAITALLLTAGFALKNEWLLLGLAGAAALVSAVIGLTIGGPLKGKLNAQILRSAPRALLQSALYAVPGFAAVYFFTIRKARVPAGQERHILSTNLFFTAAPFLLPAFFAGLTIFSQCRTPFRRSRAEAKGLNIALIAIFALFAAVSATSFIPSIARFIQDINPNLQGIAQAFCLMIGYAALCGLILFGNFRRGDL